MKDITPRNQYELDDNEQSTNVEYPEEPLFWSIQRRILRTGTFTRSGNLQNNEEKKRSVPQLHQSSFPSWEYPKK